MIKNITPTQLRAYKKLSNDYLTAKDLEESTSTLNVLVKKGLAIQSGHSSLGGRRIRYAIKAIGDIE